FLDGLHTATRTPAAGTAKAAKKSRSGPVQCRICGAALIAAVERKLGRCPTCPSDRDDVLFDSLREWRAGRAKELGQPAYCVFTDATLVAIAEQKPVTVAGLVAIAGIGQVKLDKFGDDVLSLVEASS
ncbi:MAG: ATP-dependent helicase UvrD/PcrA, partial [Actinomycetota bacterium]|nr:ATP-dependent helicase UvrD/PcrA [Actinomycetota bacterium]